MLPEPIRRRLREITKALDEAAQRIRPQRTVVDAEIHSDDSAPARDDSEPGTPRSGSGSQAVRTVS